MAYESGRQRHGRDSLAEIAKNTRRTAEVLIGSGSFSGAGLATEAKQDSIITQLTNNNSYSLNEVWLTVPGNSVSYTYYSGVVPGNNPSGNTNVETIVFSDGGGAVFTQTYSYNLSDDLVSVAVS